MGSPGGDYGPGHGGGDFQKSPKVQIGGGGGAGAEGVLAASHQAPWVPHREPQLPRGRRPRGDQAPPGTLRAAPHLATSECLGPGGMRPLPTHGLIVPRWAEGPSWVIPDPQGTWIRAEGWGGVPDHPHSPHASAPTIANHPSSVSPLGPEVRGWETSPRLFPGKGDAPLPRPHSLSHEMGTLPGTHTPPSRMLPAHSALYRHLDQITG